MITYFNWSLEPNLLLFLNGPKSCNPLDMKQGYWQPHVQLNECNAATFLHQRYAATVLCSMWWCAILLQCSLVDKRGILYCVMLNLYARNYWTSGTVTVFAQYEILPHTDTETHTHIRFMAFWSLGLFGWTGTRKVKPLWILLKQETVSCSGISSAICKSAPCPRQITTPAPHDQFFTAQMPFLLPNQ